MFGLCLSTANQADSSLLPLQWHLLTFACNTSLQYATTKMLQKCCRHHAWSLPQYCKTG